MSVRFASAFYCSVSLFVLAVLSPAAAQEAAPAAKSGSTAQIEEITVTARRREEDVQKVPIAISAVSGAALEQHSVSDGQDLSRMIPALTTNQLTRDEEGYAIRGLTDEGASIAGQENNVASYFNQVPFPTGDGGGPGRYYDLSNVQVLKGPQGTLFGRNSTGGAVLFEPNRPGADFDGYGSVQYGNYNDQVYEGMVNIPIVPDELTVRIAGKREERDGFTTNILNGQKLDNRDYWSGRIGIEWRPTQWFNNYALFDSLYSHTAGTSQEISEVDPGFKVAELSPSFQPTAGACYLALTLGGTGGPVPGCSAPFSFSLYPNPILQKTLALQQSLGPRQVASDVDSIDKTWSWGFSDIATFDLAPNLTVKNILGYREYKNLTRLDEDGSGLPLLEQVTKNGWSQSTAQYTEEVNIHAKLLDDKLDVTAGNFFLFDHPAGDMAIVGSDLLGASLPVGYTSVQDIHTDETSEALYAEAVYDLSGIWPELAGLKLTAGYRYTWDHRSLNETEPKIGSPVTCVFGTPPNCGLDVTAPFQAPSWNIGLDYQLDPTTLLYVTARRGYRDGGLNTVVAEASQVLFKPEIVKDWEIGLKNDWNYAGFKGRTDLALYHDDVQGAQASQAFTDAAGIPVQVITNEPASSVNGIELDETVIPIPDVQVTASWDYTKASYDHYVKLTSGGSAGVAEDLGSGQPWPFTPLNRFSLNVRYYIPVPESWGDVSVSGTEYYSTHFLLGADPFPGDTQSSYHQLDLHLDWNQIGGRPVDLSLFATNVYNSVYRIGGYPILEDLGYATFTYNEPQMFGLKLKYRFGAGAE